MKVTCIEGGHNTNWLQFLAHSVGHGGRKWILNEFKAWVTLKKTHREKRGKRDHGLFSVCVYVCVCWTKRVVEKSVKQVSLAFILKF